jgi:hypothetical protein
LPRRKPEVFGNVNGQRHAECASLFGPGNRGRKEGFEVPAPQSDSGIHFTDFPPPRPKNPVKSPSPANFSMTETMETMDRYRLSQKPAMLPSNEHLRIHTARSAAR